MAQGMVNYSPEGPYIARDANTGNGNVRRHTVLDSMGLVRDCSMGLVEEVGELRARLAGLLVETPKEAVEKYMTPPAGSKIAHEMVDILNTLQKARELVRLTISELDL